MAAARTKLSARVVVCGGGLLGLTTTYNLAKRGVTVLLFERDCIGAYDEHRPANASIVTAPYFWPDAMAQRMARRSHKMYARLAKEAKFRYARCGRIYLGQSDEALCHIKQIHSRSLVHSDANELYDCPSEILAKWPMLATEDIRLALHSVDDCVLDHAGLCIALADAAKEHGAKIYENCEVTRVLVGDNRAVYAVDTDDGLCETPVFVNAAGALSDMIVVSPLAERTIRIPAYPCTYTSLLTEPLPHSGLDDSTPSFVDVDNSTFISANEHRTIAGGFAEEAVQALRMPQNVQTTERPWKVPESDWDNFYPVLKSLVDRCPALGKLASGDLHVGVEMFSADGYPVIGECEEINGYFVANGLNGQGLAMAGGLGEILAQWIVEGATSLTKDISKFDVTRFSRQHTNRHYLYQRAPEIASYTFKPRHYSHQCHTARNLRMSPVYHQLRNAGAMFGEIMGFERPLWFEPDQANKPGRNVIVCGQNNAFGYPQWHDFVAKEYQACRERIGLLDLSSFAKFDVTGPDVVPFLQRICSANIDKPVGTTLYTGMQNGELAKLYVAGM